jgi:thiamine biosynthesis lipoprotein
MAAENEIQVHSEDSALAERAAALAIAEVQRIEAKYSRYRADSVVSRINANAGRVSVPVDQETRALLAYADTCWRQSDGAFDATSGVLRRAWDFKVARVPGDAELAALAACVGWDRVEVGPEGVRLRDRGMELDFGGFGKEYAVDRAALVLREAGIASALVDLAGDIMVVGSQPDGTPWRVGVRHPRDRSRIVATLAIESGAIATSGDYERFIEVDGVRHCHVLDPRTGRSARGFQSVTVHAASCLVAGSATTVAMVMGEARGLEWLESFELAYLAVTAAGRVVDRFSDKIQAHSRTS